VRTAGRGRRAGVRAQDGRGAGRRARCGPAARPHTDAPPSHPPTPRAWHPSAALVPGLCLAASCMLSAVSRAICRARRLPATFAAARLRSCTKPGLARREPPLCIPQGRPVHGCACVSRRRRGAAVPRAARGRAARRVCGGRRPAQRPRRRARARAALPEQPPERRAARGPPQLHQGHCAPPCGGLALCCLVLSLLLALASRSLRASRAAHSCASLVEQPQAW